MLLLTVTVAAAYYYYNWQYFLLIKELLRMTESRLRLVFLSFAVNYLFFCVCSILEFPLISNWLLFAVLLFFETLIYDKGDKRCALFGTLLGIIGGLSVNIFCRSVIAILMNLPLQSFDNHVSSVANLKRIPVCLGFILAGGIMQLMRRPVPAERLRTILKQPRHQTFLLEMMAGLFLYLFLNLLLYSAPKNDIFLKVWSIKSCLFCVTGLYIAVRYTWRICELNEYREKNRKIEQELEERQKEEEFLRRQATLDTLTGLYNRQYAEEVLAALMEKKTVFSLCFLDLDGLKYVNDRYGHEEGDRYILTAAEQLKSACRSGKDVLCRYGGDEFLILFAGMTPETAEKRAEAINERLCSLKNEKAFPYPLSFSYGVTGSGEHTGWKEMVSEADRKMYEQKQKKQTARV